MIYEIKNEFLIQDTGMNMVQIFFHILAECGKAATHIVDRSTTWIFTDLQRIQSLN